MGMIKIDISQLDDGDSLEVSEGCDANELNLATQDIRYCAPLDVRGTVLRTGESVLFTGTMSSQVKYTCTRCLNTINTHLAEPFELYFPVKDDTVEIDPVEELREVIMLSYPLKVLCTPECKGLCQKCGTDLNAKECDCDKEAPKDAPPNPFEKLGNWYQKEHPKEEL